MSEDEIAARVHECLALVHLEGVDGKMPSRAVRGHAPPRRIRPRHRAAAGDPALRRAEHRPRPDHLGGDRQGHRRDARTPARHDGHDHPRHGVGVPHRRPDRHAARRAHPRRRAAGRVPRPARRVHPEASSPGSPSRKRRWHEPDSTTRRIPARRAGHPRRLHRQDRGDPDRRQGQPDPRAGGFPVRRRSRREEPGAHRRRPRRPGRQDRARRGPRPGHPGARQGGRPAEGRHAPR